MYRTIGAMWLGWECWFHHLLLMFNPSVAMTSSRRATDAAHRFPRDDTKVKSC